MLNSLKKKSALKRIQKTMLYSRLRQHVLMSEAGYVDDRDKLDAAPPLEMDWPRDIEKPRVGIVRDLGDHPRWTKYRRFLETNSFPHGLYDIHAHDWLDKARDYDVVAGLVSSELDHLEEIQKKYYLLETYLGKSCFPSAAHAFLYENKGLEAYLSELYGLPFARTHISHRKEDALALTETLKYPVVSKVNPGSGSIGVELVRTPQQARKIVRQAFSRNGRKIYVPYFRQKNYVYFQEFIPNDGYDVRVIMVGNWAFGYFRKVLGGDFRASGMDTSERRALPEEAVRVAWQTAKRIGSPLLVVDMVHGLDGQYSIIEYSPVCQLVTPEALHVDGVPGVYVIDEEGHIRFEQGRFWVAEAALREFLSHDYLPNITARRAK